MSTKARSQLEIDEDLRFQELDWRVQRIGWGALGLIVVAGLTGFLGSGPLSDVRAKHGALDIQYQRFVRHGADSQLHVRAQRSAVVSGEVRVTLERDFLGAYQLQRITPEPTRTTTRGDGIEFAFSVQSADAPADAPLEVSFELQPEQLGSHSGSIALNGGPSLPVDQFTYP